MIGSVAFAMSMSFVVHASDVAYAGDGFDTVFVESNGELCDWRCQHEADGKGRDWEFAVMHEPLVVEADDVEEMSPCGNVPMANGPAAPD